MVQSIADAVIFTHSPEVSKAVKDQLQLKAVSNIVDTHEEAKVVDCAERFPHGLFVLDWDSEPKAVVKILKECVEQGGMASRPILLLARNITATLATVAMEYGVTQIHTGPIDAKELSAHIGNAIRRGLSRSEFKDDIVRVQKAKLVGDMEKVKSILNELREKKPESLFLRSELAEVLFQEGNPKDALKVLTPVPEMNPPNAKYLHIYARCLMKMGIFKEAEAVFTKISLMNPYDPDKLVGLGESYLNLGMLDEADETFEKALKLESDSQEAIIGKGKVMLLQGDINQALELVEGSVSTAETASMFNTSAVLLIRKERYAEGMKLYQAAVKALGGRSKRTLAKLYFNMGIGYRRQKDPENAKVYFDKACETDPNYEVAKANLAVMERILSRGDGPKLSVVEGTGAQNRMSYSMESEANVPPNQSEAGIFEDDFTDDFDDHDDDDMELEETIYS